MPSRRARYTHDDDSDSMDTNSERGGTPHPQKSSGACVDCKSVKVRCEPIPGERKCRRCQLKNLPCRPRERKKRKPAETHEQLQERSLEQDVQIQQLLRQYDQILAEQRATHRVTKATQGDSTLIDATQSMKWLYKGKSPESAVCSYFPPPSTPHPVIVPEIIKHCTLYPEEVVELFSIYFRDINPYFSILDPDYHTPAKLIWTSPFLFTVVCSVASRYYTTRPSLYTLATEFARDLAGRALVEDLQSIDVCQAYLIMAMYPTPHRTFAEDRSWLLTGVAIRMAMELGLNQPPPPACEERESLNRVRTWLHCYYVDSAHAIQYGKTPMLASDDYLARHCRYWYKSSPLNTLYDIHLCTYVQLLVQMSEWGQFLQSTGTMESCDVIAAAMKTQDALTVELDSWDDAYADEYNFMPLPISTYRTHTTHMIVAYLRLAVLLVAFQRTDPDKMTGESDVFLKSVDAARTVIQIMLERLYPSGYLRYAVDSTFLYVSFAAAFLLHLFRPQYRSLLGDNLQREIATLVSRLATVLGASDVALDGKHTPALYSRFLSSLMTKYNVSSPRKPSRCGSMVEIRSPTSTCSTVDSTDLTMSSDVFQWPNVTGVGGGGNGALQCKIEAGFGGVGGMETDFSLSHFIRTVSAQEEQHHQTQHQHHNLLQLHQQQQLLVVKPMESVLMAPGDVDSWMAWTNEAMWDATSAA